MPSIGEAELIRRLLVAAALGAVLGLERELRQRTAGLRTNVLIALGSALFTLVSYEFAGEGGDTGRVAAQIVTGIGFLGAGAIMRTDSGIQGLTTAATVWVNAAVGMAAGAGAYALAITTTATALAALLVLTPVERMLARRVAAPERDGNRDI